MKFDFKFQLTFLGSCNPISAAEDMVSGSCQCYQLHLETSVVSEQRFIYSKRFKSYRHFSRTGRGQNLHKLSGDKIKCLIIGHSMKFNFKFQLTLLGSCNKYLVYVRVYFKNSSPLRSRSECSERRLLMVKSSQN